MRDIKFRAWNEKNDFMDEDFYIHSSGSQYDLAERNYNTPHIEIEKTELKLMQYTGLKDKNGVEIYEGDIVTTSIPMFRDKKLTVKVYEKGGCFLLTGSNTHVNLINVASDSIQVIGNIYENPELLEEN